MIVGGDAAGLSAARKCKREDPDREVVVFERGEWISYAHCGTPYYVKGDAPELTDILTLRPEDVAEWGIDLRRNHEVVSVSPVDDLVVVDGPDGRFEQPFGDLLVATGARARTESVPDRDLDGAFTLHGLVPVSRTVTAGSRSGYYPGAEETTVTLVADRDSGRLLGGAIVGRDRAADRIDAIAIAIEAGLTVPEFQRLDLAYAPPFSPVWDPVLVAAKVLAGEVGGDGRSTLTGLRVDGYT